MNACTLRQREYGGPQSASEKHGLAQLNTAAPLPQPVLPSAKSRQLPHWDEQISEHETQAPLRQMGRSPLWQFPHGNEPPQPLSITPQASTGVAHVLQGHAPRVAPGYFRRRRLLMRSV
jgi:hypothetical protein